MLWLPDYFHPQCCTDLFSLYIGYIFNFVACGRARPQPASLGQGRAPSLWLRPGLSGSLSAVLVVGPRACMCVMCAHTWVWVCVGADL